MKVLFVEDDALNRRVVKDMLSVVGASMAEADDAAAGLRMIDEHDYNVILMDLRMPGMDGDAAIRVIRDRGDAKSQLPVIVVTADTAIDLHQRCMDAGADEVLRKPIAMGPLLNAMGRLMAKGRGAATLR